MNNYRKIIELKNINQKYKTEKGEVHIIKDLNLSINDIPDTGEFIVILGPSGCGKSTLLRYIADLQKPTSGTVLVNDKLPSAPGNQVGMVFQKYSSFPWLTVLDNVSYGLKILGVSNKERSKLAMDIIETVGLKGNEHKYAQYPNLSGGQLQRVAIARSLLANPEILLMDEPFGALDIGTKLQMQQLLLSIYKEIQPTIVMVTHDISEAVFLADKIYVMSKAPSNFVGVLNVRDELGFNRMPEIKRSSKFVELVQTIESNMMFEK